MRRRRRKGRAGCPEGVARIAVGGRQRIRWRSFGQGGHFPAPTGI